jgi:molybdate transport system substrate-binding protein
MSNAVATKIKVLSAGAVQPGMVKVIDSFRRETGHGVKVTFATAPAILKRIGDATIADIVIAPPAVLDEWVKAGKAASANRVTVGRIGVGVMVRDGAPLPKIGTVDDFKQSLLSAEAIVYNQASTGIYLETLFRRLGIAEPLKTKTTRYPDAAAVLNHVSKGKGNEIGLGAVTVIIEGESKGLKFVGPLPAEIQNYTTYTAMVVADGVAPDGAQEFVRYLTGPASRKAFAAAGIE